MDALADEDGVADGDGVVLGVPETDADGVALELADIPVDALCDPETETDGLALILADGL